MLRLSGSFVLPMTALVSQSPWCSPLLELDNYFQEPCWNPNLDISRPCCRKVSWHHDLKPNPSHCVHRRSIWMECFGLLLNGCTPGMSTATQLPSEVPECPLMVTSTVWAPLRCAPPARRVLYGEGAWQTPWFETLWNHKSYNGKGQEDWVHSVSKPGTCLGQTN